MSDPGPHDDTDEPDADETDAEAIIDGIVSTIPSRGVIGAMLVGAAIVVVLSVAIPAAYHSTQPADYYIETEDAVVDGQMDAPCSLDIEATYWSREPRPVTLETALFRVTDGGDERVQVQRWRDDEYIGSGIERVAFSRTLAKPLENGEYVFVFDVHFEVSHGFDKTHEAVSGPFHVRYVSETTAEETALPPHANTILFNENASCG